MRTGSLLCGPDLLLHALGRPLLALPSLPWIPWVLTLGHVVGIYQRQHRGLRM